MSTALAVIGSKLADRFGIGADADVVSILKATAFKGPATDAQLTALLIVANQYGLNPFTKEIYAFPDKNNGIVPVVGIDGWSRIINENPMFDGMEFVEGDGWTDCVIFRKDRSHSIKVREYMIECRREGFGPWKTHPQRMLRHKSMIQCARIAFGFVGIYDPDEAERIIEADATLVTQARPGLQATERAIPPDSPERDKLIAALIDVADGGVEKFRDHWKAMPKEDRALVWDKVDTFKARAETADAARTVEAPQ